MSTQKILKEFEIIYKNTYNKILKYVICKCSNLDDVNDIIQETYIEFYKKLKENKKIQDKQAFIIGIAKNKIMKYINQKENINKIWEYIKNQNQISAKIFYLYFVLEMTFKDISKELNLKESKVKTNLYRMVKKVKEAFGGERFE